jgi:hypothetical protein
MASISSAIKKAWGWWAKFQLRDQKGEDAGQWIEMGGLGPWRRHVLRIW